MKTKGFTLVELLVVIAILAILATVSVVGYTSFINNANNSVALSELTQVRDFHIANQYTDDNTAVTALPAKLGLKGNVVTEDIDHDENDQTAAQTWARYTTSDGKGVAYWNTVTGEVTTTKPEKWTTQ